MTAAAYLIVGGALLAAVLLPRALSRVRVTAPMVLVGVGMVIGALPLGDGLPLDVVDDGELVTHLAEATVLVALLGVGLALDRPLRLLDRATWRAWSPTWRLLAVAMPLTIGGVALLAGGLGLAAPTALLLGAALAPTDPVLASEVQVAGPTQEGDPDEIDETDEVRFALTSEAGLNDGLAFPFVWGAILLAVAAGSGEVSDAVHESVWRWLAWDLVGKIVIGVAAGIAVGWVLGRVAFRAPSRHLRLSEIGEPLLGVAAVALAYGVAEAAHGYGFLAVFVAAIVIRGVERDHDYHRHMHETMQQLEHLLTLVVLLGLGIMLTDHVLAAADWRAVVIALAVVFVIRPLSGLVAFVGHRTERGHQGLDSRERLVTAFFGVRGVGSIFYVAFASTHALFPELRWVWASVGLAIVLSVVVHGRLAGPAMAWQERSSAHRRGMRGDPTPVS